MIQLNLLPDVKLEYIKAQRMRSLVTGISFVVTAAAILILVLTLLFGFAQKQRISSLKTTIAEEANQLKNKPGINDILTVQNQLSSLNTLYSQRPAVDRLFTTYLNEITPETASLNQMQVDFATDSVTLNGSADSIVTINKYVDTLKLTNYSLNNSSNTTPAFKNIVLASFGVNSSAQNPNQAASFNITLNYDPNIFNVAENVKLVVPNLVVTHYQQSDSASLFTNAPPASTTKTSGGN